ncbi:phosphatidylinositol-specific phospholipase C [Flavobacterium sp. 7A]|uniref:phosphatidylinositol-specific phospholipase C n=1 Tax=Flavobacterium sp. 7A TaxID=2940571 RepID=UPI0022270B5D|nr:phosphatidylinositol-specific phospholipase C [Flavobacterium sp. 7A]MCW2119920.1 1-phosphatidylinositol phosphodiesterase [Flavobacterium sp. 7A]
MGSTKSFLKIVNQLENRIAITVTGTDNVDWDGSSRPDNNFNNISINGNSSREEREELNNNTKSAWFTMNIKFDNGDDISFRNDQHDVYKKIDRIYKEIKVSSGNVYYITQKTSNLINTFFISSTTSKNWMKSIPDATSLLNISIPGTHESCALAEPIWAFGFAKCQNWELTEQLEKGVRYLDIRAEAIEESKGNYLTIKHGSAQQKIDFNGVLKLLTTFLESNPSETILMQLKQESSEWETKAYADLVKSYYDKGEYNKFIDISDSIPTMGKARGKIVIINRFTPVDDFGISVYFWGDNTSFSKKTNNRTTYNVQDNYLVSSNTTEWCRDDKMNHINYFFSEYAFKKDCLNLCFCSATGVNKKEKLNTKPWATPYNIAADKNGVNERTIIQHLKSKKGWNGILLFDFIDSYSDTINYIIRNNFIK